MTAWRLMFRRRASASSSASMPIVKSTFTRCTSGRGSGGIICPLPAKYRVTSSPRSAARAICSADGLVLLAFFIPVPLCFRRFPQRHEVIVTALIVGALFVDDRVEPCLHPADGNPLLGVAGQLIEKVRR